MVRNFLAGVNCAGDALQSAAFAGVAATVWMTSLRLSTPTCIILPKCHCYGRNDPRVPYTEAEQIVETVRKGGAPVWYLLADNVGHGFAKKENADYYFYATIRFRQVTVLK